jgi:hypothetical protein
MAELRFEPMNIDEWWVMSQSRESFLKEKRKRSINFERRERSLL